MHDENAKHLHRSWQVTLVTRVYIDGPPNIGMHYKVKLMHDYLHFILKKTKYRFCNINKNILCFDKTDAYLWR